MRSLLPFTFALVLLGGRLVLDAAPEVKWPEPTKEGLDFFEREVRPVLANACYDCHSSSAEKVKGDLLLDTFSGVSKGGSNGAVIVPGDPDKSPLVEAIRGEDKDFMMPPKEKLPDQVRIVLERWVKMGAPMPRTEAPMPVAKSEQPKYKMMDVAEAKKRWQFQPVVERPYPKVRNTGWSPHPIDLYLMAKWEPKQLVPALPADKRTLLRRATFDLTGLPPSPLETSQFLADSSPTAFNKVVERLLASPAYGERWGRHWLDVVRYADTGGDSADYPIPEAYKYRDYVIDAFNADKPYNVFLKEQLAGDLLPTLNEAQKKERLIATGYLAMSRRFGVAPQMELTIDDTIDNVSKGLLGLTVACARCHDHKFDPIPTRDYYALYGIFASTKYPFPGSENVKRPSDFVPLVSKEQVEKALAPHKGKLDAFDADIARIKKERDETKKAGDGKTPKDFRKLIADVEKKRAQFTDTLPKFELAYAVSEAKPKDEPVHIRGDSGKKGELVPRQFLTVLGGQKLTGEQAKQSGRLQLAEWIADPKNPLTARVMVNRIWQRHFGKGLVATPNDWGKQGKPPAHPELVDFLAQVFVKNGYSIKNMHRLIMSSKAYQMSSDELPANMAIDGGNDLLWHFSRQRLDAESIRDSILAVSGNLDRTRPGAHPFPPQDKWGFTQHAAFSAVYTNDNRSVYQMQQRIKKHPFFGLFDGADTNACTAERPLSTTPLQALFMMNDEFIKGQSEMLADRLLKEQPSDPQRVLLAWWLAYQRAPQPDETNDALSFLRQYAVKFKAAKASAQPAELGKQSFAALSRVLFTSNEFLFND